MNPLAKFMAQLVAFCFVAFVVLDITLPNPAVTTPSEITETKRVISKEYIPIIAPISAEPVEEPTTYREPDAEKEEILIPDIQPKCNESMIADILEEIHTNIHADHEEYVDNKFKTFYKVSLRDCSVGVIESKYHERYSTESQQLHHLGYVVVEDNIEMYEIYYTGSDETQEEHKEL